jgi:hypothetical protein
MDALADIRQHVVALLQGGQAYDTFDAIVAEFPTGLRGVVPAGAERSAWQIVAHLRIAQADILEFSTRGDYKEKNWPADYWPSSPTPPHESSWDETLRAYLDDRRTLESLISDPASDLLAPLPWGDGQTLLREALLAADHQSHHLGQLVLLRRLL